MASSIHKIFVLISLSTIFSTTLIIVLEKQIFIRPSFIAEYKLKREPVNFTVKYMDANTKICHSEKNNLELLIVVTSAPSHKELRSAIRKTWGNSTENKLFCIAFLIGYTHNKSIERFLKSEQYVYGDLIRAIFIDTYDNMTLKTITMLDWTSKFCKNAKFLLKTDDDTFINVYKLMIYLAIIPEEMNAIYGNLLRGTPTCRNVSSKYYLSVEQYEHDILPDFLSGSTYLVPMHLIEKLLISAQMHPFIKLEDVFITGFVANDLQISLVHTSLFHYFSISNISYCYVKWLISIHYVNVEQLYELWEVMRYSNEKCY